MELASRFFDVYSLVFLAMWSGVLFIWVVGAENTQCERFTYKALALILIVFSATRYETGYDWPAYKEFYLFGDVLEGKYEFELGFRALANVFREIGSGFPFFQGVVSALQVFFTALFIRKFFGGLSLFALAVYYTIPDLYLINSFSLMRQGLALSLFLCGAIYYLNRRVFLAVIFFVAALMFHASSAFAIVAFFIVRFFGPAYGVAVVSVWGLALCYMLGISVPSVVVSALVKLPYFEKYAIYGDLDTPSASVAYKLLFVALFLSLFIVACYRRRFLVRAGLYDSHEKMKFGLAYLAVCISFFFWAYPTFLSRFQAFFVFFLLAWVLQAFDFKRVINRFLLCIVVLGLSGALYAKFVMTNISMVYFPYQSIFTENIESLSTGGERTDELYEELRWLWRGVE
ncbi:EpsG family protein [Pseudomonas wayambapalatensis]|uniref:EpsG family protein n=1 Tax=Pseudomonas wayambapalatensis TaxID=485895 RepID=UPI003CF6D53F